MEELKDMYTISEKELADLQRKSFSLLCVFKEFCDKHNLRFFLSGGSCLGAVRHKGFIPWDDDIDLLMPRKDYEKLEELWNKYADTNKYSICRPSATLANGNKFITIHDNNTTFIELGRDGFDANQGVALEILPLDGYPKNKMDRYFQLFWATIFALYANRCIPKKATGWKYNICKFALWVVQNRKLQYKIFSFCEKKMSQYDIDDCDAWAVLCTYKNIHHKYHKEMFDKVEMLEFNGVKMPNPSDWDGYLKILYGDYMKLPPTDEQIHKHDCVYLDLDSSYVKYKGVYYGEK